MDAMLRRNSPPVLLCLVLSAAMLVASLPTNVSAQSVLRTARGLASDNVAVLVNRAVVVESAQPFVEVSVAQPEIADVSPLSDRSIYIFGRASGTTTLTLLGENGQLIANVDIQVTPDLATLKQRLSEVIPDEPIDVRATAGGVILSGVVSGKAKIDRAIALAEAFTGGAVVNMMAVGGTQQVALKVRIAEMSRDAAKSLGVSFELGGSTVGAGETPGGGDVTGVIGSGTSDPGDAPPFVTPASAFGTVGAIFNITDTLLAAIQIDLNEEKGFARTLSEPTLVALSGTQASFLAGGEVPIPVVTEEDGADVEFKPIGVALAFIPTVLDDDVISIALATEVTSVGDLTVGFEGGLAVPSFNTTRAETTIELRDGESFAIAGLFVDNFSDAAQQLPWLGDVPVLGTLFRSADFQREESELVIMVTANLVTPVADASALQIPNDRIAIPNERSLFLLGDTEGPATAAGAASQGFDGSFGYVVE